MRERFSAQNTSHFPGSWEAISDSDSPIPCAAIVRLSLGGALSTKSTATTRKQGRSHAQQIKHMAFFEAGAKYNSALLHGGQIGIGKTEGETSTENALHLTGRYPPWWKGRRFSRPVSVWAVEDVKTVRDILQAASLGPGPHFGLGLLPADAIHHSEGWHS